jgi:hypothetical protein
MVLQVTFTLPYRTAGKVQVSLRPITSYVYKHDLTPPAGLSLDNPTTVMVL